MGGACKRAATVGDKKMNSKITTVLSGIALWLAGIGLVFAQANAIETVDVAEQAGKVVVRITTKEPLRSVPPNFAIASPARIAFDFPNTTNALGRSSQEIGQGELRSMNVVQGAERTRLVLNLRRSVVHEATLDGRSLVINLAGAEVAQGAAGKGEQFAPAKTDGKHAVRDVD